MTTITVQKKLEIQSYIVNVCWIINDCFPEEQYRPIGGFSIGKWFSEDSRYVLCEIMIRNHYEEVIFDLEGILNSKFKHSWEFHMTPTVWSDGKWFEIIIK